jgi:hypothetical protein
VIFFFLAGLLGTVMAGLTALHQTDAREDGPAVAPFGPAVLCAAAIVALFAVQTGLLAHAAAVQVPFPTWFRALPLLAIDDRSPLHGHAAFGPFVGLCALAETLACALFYNVTRRRRLSRATLTCVVAAGCTMFAIALFAPVLTSFDLYAYAGSANVPDAYRPPRLAFSGEFFAINRYYGVPIFPSAYGPVWLGLARLVTLPFASLGAQLVALRLCGAVALALCAVAVRAAGAGEGESALVALNPGLVSYFVLDGHNDIAGVALVVAAVALVRRSWTAAVLLGILAGGIKLPFLIVGMLAFAPLPSLRARLTGAALTLGGGLALSIAFGGRAYLAALQKTAYIYRGALRDWTANELHLALALVALGAVALALLRRTYWPTASWAHVALAATIFGWYFAWGLPYAVLERRWLGVFLVSLPVLWFAFATSFAPVPVDTIALLCAAFIAPSAAYLELRRAYRARRVALGTA